MDFAYCRTNRLIPYQHTELYKKYARKTNNIKKRETEGRKREKQKETIIKQIHIFYHQNNVCFPKPHLS